MMKLINIQENYPNSAEFVFNIFDDICKQYQESRKLDLNYEFPSHILDITQLKEIESHLDSNGKYLPGGYSHALFPRVIEDWIIDNFYEITYSQDTLI